MTAKPVTFEGTFEVSPDLKRGLEDALRDLERMCERGRLTIDELRAALRVPAAEPPEDDG